MVGKGAERLKIPFYRMGLPMFDRLGAGHLLSVGYRGTRDLLFDLSNLIMRRMPKNTMSRRLTHGGQRTARHVTPQRPYRRISVRGKVEAP